MDRKTTKLIADKGEIKSQLGRRDVRGKIRKGKESGGNNEEKGVQGTLRRKRSLEQKRGEHHLHQQERKRTPGNDSLRGVGGSEHQALRWKKK